MKEEEAFILVVALLALAAYTSRKYLSPRARLAVSGAAFFADLADCASA
jgi:hypothetical protein